MTGDRLVRQLRVKAIPPAASTVPDMDDDELGGHEQEVREHNMRSEQWHDD